MMSPLFKSRILQWNWMLSNPRHASTQFRPKFGIANGLVCLCLICAGCESSGRVQVSGKVEFLDGSVPTGEIAMIRFEPTSYAKGDKNAIRKGAYGYIKPDGSFRMTTLKPEDGVYPDTYKVCFTVMKTYGGGEAVIPRKYMSKKTTPFEETIQESVDDLHFKLEPLPTTK